MFDVERFAFGSIEEFPVGALVTPLSRDDGPYLIALGGNRKKRRVYWSNGDYYHADLENLGGGWGTTEFIIRAEPDGARVLESEIGIKRGLLVANKGDLLISCTAQQGTVESSLLGIRIGVMTSFGDALVVFTSWQAIIKEGDEERVLWRFPRMPVTRID